MACKLDHNETVWRARGGVDCEFGIFRCKLLYIEQINNKVLMHSTGNYTQYPVIHHSRTEYGKECIYT